MWISVKDKLPDDSYSVVVIGEGNADIARWDEGEWHLDYDLFVVEYWAKRP